MLLQRCFQDLEEIVISVIYILSLTLGMLCCSYDHIYSICLPFLLINSFVGDIHTEYNEAVKYMFDYVVA